MLKRLKYIPLERGQIPTKISFLLPQGHGNPFNTFNISPRVLNGPAFEYRRCVRVRERPEHLDFINNLFT